MGTGRLHANQRERRVSGNDTRLTVVVSSIDVSVFEAKQTTATLRAELSPRRYTRSAHLLRKERAMAAGAAVIVNVGLLCALTLDTSVLRERLSRRVGASLSAQVLDVFFIEAPGVPMGSVSDHAIKLRAPRVDLPLQFSNLGIPDSVAGDAQRNVGAVATAISIVSPENERRRLRLVYQEQLETYLAQRVSLQPAAERRANCVVRLRQSTGGQIVDVNMTDCERAIGELSVVAVFLERVAALPLPPRPDIFDPELIVTFGKRVSVQLASEQYQPGDHHANDL